MPSSVTGVQTCARSEEHTSELQSHDNIVCRLLLEKKKVAPALVPGAGSETARRRSASCAVLPEVVARAWIEARASWLGVESKSAGAFFFFNDTATPEISPLPLHAALPI